MDKFLSILEQGQEIEIDESKLGYIASQISIWDYFGLTNSQYLRLSPEEKLKMLKEYYVKNLNDYFGMGKINFFYFVFSFCSSTFVHFFIFSFVNMFICSFVHVFICSLLYCSFSFLFHSFVFILSFFGLFGI